MLDRLESLVLELVATASTSRASPSVLLRDAFRQHDLRPRQQKRIRDLLLYVLGSSRLLDYAIANALPGGVARQAVGAVRLLAAELLSGAIAPAQARVRIGWVDWDRVAAAPAQIAALPDPVQRIALRGSLPDWLAAQLYAQMGDEAEALAHALTLPPPVTLRANTLRGSREQLAARFAAAGVETRPTRHAAHGLEVVTPTRLFRCADFHAGWFELQDEASQLVAEIVAPPPQGLVVDVCAGAGGKTLALAAALANRGTLWAFDIAALRLRDLRVRLRRAGASNVRVQAVSADEWPAEVAALVRRADRVLVDAPCSGFGTLRRNPEMRWRMDAGELVRIRATQADLMRRAAALLAPGARLIYATCTMLAEENEGIVAEARAAQPDLEVVRVAEVLGSERARDITDPSGTYLRTAPHRHGADAFFAAVLRRPRPKGSD